MFLREAALRCISPFYFFISMDGGGGFKKKHGWGPRKAKAKNVLEERSAACGPYICDRRPNVQHRKSNASPSLLKKTVRNETSHMASSPPPPRELHGRRLHPAAVVRDKLARALPGNAALVEDLAGLVDAMNAAPPAPRMLFAMPLFVGPAGIGKSYLCGRLLDACGFSAPDQVVRVDLTTCPKPVDVARKITGGGGPAELVDGGAYVLPGRGVILDEIHQASPAVVQSLLDVLGRMVASPGPVAPWEVPISSKAACTVDLSNVVIVGATTDRSRGKHAGPFYDRFGAHFLAKPSRVAFEAVVTNIIEGEAVLRSLRGGVFTEDAWGCLHEHCASYREAKRRLVKVAVKVRGGMGIMDALGSVFDLVVVGGLRRDAFAYLTALAAAGRAAPVQALCHRVREATGLDDRAIKDELEPYLTRKGYLEIANSVRRITDAGREAVGSPCRLRGWEGVRAQLDTPPPTDEEAAAGGGGGESSLAAILRAEKGHPVDAGVCVDVHRGELFCRPLCPGRSAGRFATVSELARVLHGRGGGKPGQGLAAYTTEINEYVNLWRTVQAYPWYQRLEFASRADARKYAKRAREYLDRRRRASAPRVHASVACR